MDIRIDQLLIPKVKKTKEGFLRGKAIATRTGVFKYLNNDGSIRYELRHPDDILTEKSLSTLKSIPITIEHPSDLVNVDNANALVVGMTGEEVTINDGAIMVSLSITHKKAIEAIFKGKKELSLGYTLDVIEESGVYEGQKYTHRQINVDYNHLAIVDQARAGRTARLNLDSANNNILIQMRKNMINKDLEDQTEMKEVSEVNKVESNNEKFNLDSYIAKIDQLKNENEKLKTKLSQVNIDSLVAEKVKSKTALLSKINNVIALDDNDLIEKTEQEIMKTVISNFDSNINLDGKSEEYVKGMFDALIDSNKANDNFTKQMSKTVNKDSKTINCDFDNLNIQKMNSYLKLAK